MHAMQYELTLPADYDTGIVRARVARVGHLLDDWTGLGVKAYLLRERGVHGSPVSQYAPENHRSALTSPNTQGGPIHGHLDGYLRTGLQHLPH